MISTGRFERLLRARASSGSTKKNSPLAWFCLVGYQLLLQDCSPAPAQSPTAGRVAGFVAALLRAGLPRRLTAGFPEEHALPVEITGDSDFSPRSACLRSRFAASLEVRSALRSHRQAHKELCGNEKGASVSAGLFPAACFGRPRL